MFLISKASTMTDQGGNDHRDVTSKQSRDVLDGTHVLKEEET